MKIKIPFFLSLLLAGVMAHAAPPAALTVAVYDFKGDGDAASYGDNITTLVTTDLTTESNLVMLERAELTKALDEQAFGISGMVSSDAAARIGQITGAKVLVAGQVMKTGDNHLIIVANIIGTETGRLFADKVEGAADNLTELTSDLSQKISQTISAQVTNLVAAAEESHAERIDRIIKSIKGKNRPTVSVNITFFAGQGHWRDDWADDEFGAVFLKAGFPVLDDKSDRKADIEITGNASANSGPQRGDFVSSTSSIEIKIRDRLTGEIIGFDRQDSAVTGVGKQIVDKASHDKAVDELAARILPLLAK